MLQFTDTAENAVDGRELVTLFGHGRFIINAARLFEPRRRGFVDLMCGRMASIVRRVLAL